MTDELTYRGQKYTRHDSSRDNKPIRLDQVFGLNSSIPAFTYVDRSNLDSTFKYFLDSQKHIVIHGASKQGKTVLRKQNLDEEECIKIQCTSTTTVKDIYVEILRQLDTKIERSLSTERAYGQNASMKLKGGMGPAFSLEGGAGGVRQRKTTSEYEVIGNESGNLYFLTEELLKADKRVVIEDFHYLAEN